MPARMTLPHLTADRPFVTDGGLETTLVFKDGIDLPDFAAFPLLDTESGRAALTRYYSSYLDVAARLGLGMIVDTPTWRANLDWGARLGYDPVGLADVNRRAVEFVVDLVKARPTVATVSSGVIGPRGDGYVVGATMSASEAAAYHGLQARSFAEAGAQVVSAITMTYSDEAIGVARAASAVALPAVISFTVETDGLLPSGETIAAAIGRVDEATDASPAYYMINCAHPSHFTNAIDADSEWARRIRGVRANASRLSHAELDESTELDRGDITELAALYDQLNSRLDLCVVGGCCGTDDEHIAAIATAIVRAETVR
jgi:homocysteine S-methyltransferase